MLNLSRHLQRRLPLQTLGKIRNASPSPARRRHRPLHRAVPGVLPRLPLRLPVNSVPLPLLPQQQGKVPAHLAIRLPEDGEMFHRLRLL